MRHRYSGRQLGRDTAHRESLMRNLTKSLFEHEVIKTTLPKAKELRRFAEPLITLAKRKNDVSGRRLVFSRIRDKVIVGKIFNLLAPRYRERPGGYTRILKCGFRMSDNAPMAIIELVDRRQEEVSKKAAPKAKKAAPKVKKESVPKTAAEKETATKPKKAAALKVEKEAVSKPKKTAAAKAEKAPEPKA